MSFLVGMLGSAPAREARTQLQAAASSIEGAMIEDSKVVNLGSLWGLLVPEVTLLDSFVSEVKSSADSDGDLHLAVFDGVYPQEGDGEGIEAIYSPRSNKLILRRGLVAPGSFYFAAASHGRRLVFASRIDPVLYLHGGEASPSPALLWLEQGRGFLMRYLTEIQELMPGAPVS